jgi:hypothetical protein
MDYVRLRLTAPPPPATNVDGRLCGCESKILLRGGRTGAVMAATNCGHVAPVSLIGLSPAGSRPRESAARARYFWYSPAGGCTV